VTFGLVFPFFVAAAGRRRITPSREVVVALLGEFDAVEPVNQQERERLDCARLAQCEVG
jgi:hypothetical protein